MPSEPTCLPCRTGRGVPCHNHITDEDRNITDPVMSVTTKYEVWIQRGGLPADRSTVYLPMTDKALAFAARDECQIRMDRNVRPEAARSRYFVVEATMTRKEITS